MLRGHGRRDNMIEELADVAVMCEQLRIILGLSDEQLEDIAEAKMIRTMERGGIKVISDEEFAEMTNDGVISF